MAALSSRCVPNRTSLNRASQKSLLANRHLGARTKAILVTGACGEIGTNLLSELVRSAGEYYSLIGFDLQLPSPSTAVPCVNYIRGDVTNTAAFADLDKDFDCEVIFHLAAILSSRGERNPEHAFEVNCDGTLNVLSFARNAAARRESATRVVFPSTIAAYGLPVDGGRNSDPQALKQEIGAVCEEMHLAPITMYGINKLASEHLGRYFCRHYQLLGSDLRGGAGVDFRCLRLPGVLSANTLPAGGTSDYASEMVHAAAQGIMYQCFARPRTTIPFLSMPDAVRALLRIAEVESAKLTQVVYNVGGFSASAQEIAAEVKQHFPEAAIVFKADPNRMKILDSWPAAVDDTAARRDWGWGPQHDFRKTFRDYLIPGVRARYAGIHRDERQVSLQAGM